MGDRSSMATSMSDAGRPLVHGPPVDPTNYAATNKGVTKLTVLYAYYDKFRNIPSLLNRRYSDSLRGIVEFTAPPGQGVERDCCKRISPLWFCNDALSFWLGFKFQNAVN